MLNQVQHDEVVVASPWTRFRVSFWDAESSSAWRGSSVTQNTTYTSPWTPKKCVTQNTIPTSPWIIPLHHHEHHPYVTLNLFQGPFFEMLNQVQHDEVVVASPWTPPIRHPEFISGSRLWDAESSSAWRGSGSVTLNSFQGLVFEMLNRVQHDGV
jgi:hypothetical protein